MKQNGIKITHFATLDKHFYFCNAKLQIFYERQCESLVKISYTYWDNYECVMKDYHFRE